MGQSTESQWTIETLKEYLLRLVEEHDQRHLRAEAQVEQLRQTQMELLRVSIVDVKEAAVLALENSRNATAFALASAKEAVTKAEVANEKRFDSVNEFRNTLADQQRALIPRAEVELLVKSVDDKLTAQAALIEHQNSRIISIASGQTGRLAGTMQGWGYAVGVVGLAISIISVAVLVLAHIAK
jgi:hypothetical protein